MAQRSKQPKESEHTLRTETQIKTFLTEVRAVSYPTPRFARITFGGGDLDGFTSLGPGEFVYVLLPPAGRSALTVNRGFTWEQLKNMPETERPRGAYYTIREHRPERAELDLDFLLHSEDEESNTGNTSTRSEEALENSVSRWAAQAEPGERAALWGPRITYDPPPETDWQLLVADETGLPAVASILGSLPEGARTKAIIEVEDESEEQRLESAGEVETIWLHHGGSRTGRSTSLVEAIRNLRFPEWDSKEAVYAWGAGESETVAALRHHLRNERGVGTKGLSLTPYWQDSHRASTRRRDR